MPGDREGFRGARYAYAADEAEKVKRVAAHGVRPFNDKDVVFITSNVEGAPDAPEGAYAGHETGQEHEAFFYERGHFHRDSPKSRAQPIARPKRSEMSVRKRSLSDFAWACIMLNKG